MKQSNELLSNFYAVATISSTMLGVGLLTLPRSITEQTGNADGWIVLAIEWIVFTIVIILLARMVKSFKIDSLYDFSYQAAGKIVGNFLNAIMIIYFFSVSSFEVRAMSEMIQFYLLEHTPIEVIILTFILTSTYVLTGGMNSITKLMALFFPVTIIILLTLYALSFQMVDAKNLQPVLADGAKPIISSLTSVSVSFVGAEVMLFLPKYLKNKEDLRKISIIGFGIPLFLYIITYVLVVGALSVPEIKTVVYPTIDFVQTHEVKGIFVERLELFLLIVWLLQFFLTFIIFYFLAISGLKKMFHNQESTNIIFLVPIIFISALAPQQASDIIVFSDMLGWAFLIIFLAIPMLLTIMMSIKKRVMK
ncbi:GerAB/ArcD/ProY family transporter [Priestia megaterium]|nr:GerAB/ArcD/ProY family transporter [Priestia megaterium]